jgi:hypothetical protein
MSKSIANELNQISTGFLNRHSYFSGWRSGTITWISSSYFGDHKSSVSIEVSTGDKYEYLRIHYTQTENSTAAQRNFDYKIPLTTTPCRYGGKRYWFICPWYRNGIYCGRRVGSLYKGEDYFACRHCYDLTYETRNQSGRYKGSVSIADLEKAEKGIKRYYYRGKLTRKYRRFLDLNYKFEEGLAKMASHLISKKNDLDESKK